MHLTCSLPRFDPLALHLRCAPDAPGLLESCSHSPRTGRYSIVPLRSRESYCLRENGLVCIENGATILHHGDPFIVLEELLANRRVRPTSPEAFFPGGFFGYFGYDLAGWIEQLPRCARRDRPVPPLWLHWVDITAVYDHALQRLTLATLDATVDLHALLRQVLTSQATPLPGPPPLPDTPLPVPQLRREDFLAMVRRAKGYIAAGDIYQANLSCRFDGHFAGSAADLYGRLRLANPAPFAAMLRYPDLEIVSSSPERLVSLQDGLAETRPIAGTRPRGLDAADDQRLADELLGHPKERAEHIMLLDLERNDLGKVCQAGTVEVDELMVLERYAQVTHIVSNVRGRLRAGIGPFGLLRAVFPGGTITGVPKKRCMEIIEELEPTGRGTYTGSAGYVSATGAVDFNILIRSFQKFGDELTYQVGAGIVADSDPQREWEECLAKGKGLQRALQGEQ
jgi:para-aminobenzoate synthetase component I